MIYESSLRRRRNFGIERIVEAASPCCSSCAELI